MNEVDVMLANLRAAIDEIERLAEPNRPAVFPWDELGRAVRRLDLLSGELRTSFEDAVRQRAHWFTSTEAGRQHAQRNLPREG